jgi:hypothetical protein
VLCTPLGGANSTPRGGCRRQYIFREPSSVLITPAFQNPARFTAGRPCHHLHQPQPIGCKSEVAIMISSSGCRGSGHRHHHPDRRFHQSQPVGCKSRPPSSSFIVRCCKSASQLLVAAVSHGLMHPTGLVIIGLTFLIESASSYCFQATMGLAMGCSCAAAIWGREYSHQHDIWPLHTGLALLLPS